MLKERKFFKQILLTMVGLVFAIGQGVAGQENQHYTGLLRELDARGRIPVIVALDVPFDPNAQLMGAAAFQHQQAQIASARQAVVQTPGVKLLGRSGSWDIPSVALSVDRAGLECAHGTMVSGVAAGNDSPGGQPFSGVAPNANIIAITIFVYMPSSTNLAAFSRFVLDALLMLGQPFQNRFTTSAITLSWNHVSWATGYEIQVDNNRDFLTPEFIGNTFSNDDLDIETDPLGNDLYYWRAGCGWGSARKLDGISNLRNKHMVNVPLLLFKRAAFRAYNVDCEFTVKLSEARMICSD